MGVNSATLHQLEMAEQNVTLKTLEQIVARSKCSINEVSPER
jgi:DNA-binding Xre family transcriptional regulator